jgi:predicted dienelactone hydrolase
MQRILAITLQSLFIATLLAPSAFAEKAPKTPGYFDPVHEGPFPVGVMTTVFVDKSRTDNLTKEPRTLVTEIWYPATDEARNKPKNKYSDFIPTPVTPEIDQQLQKAYRLPLAILDKTYTNEAVRNANVRAGRFPLVVFSHGNGGTRHQNTFWCDYLASHGYIVVSADHTGNARMTIINGKVIPMANSERMQSAQDRPKDVSFLLDKMIEWNKGMDKRFAGKIDIDHVAISGMSFGSFTSHWAADQDPRFKAVVAMSGAPPTHTNLTIPTLRMLGSEDRTLGVAGNALIRHNHQIHQGPAFLLELKNGGHFSFTDMFKITKQFGDGIGKAKRRDTGEDFEFTAMEMTYKIINSYSIAFLGYYLKGEKAYLPFLKENHWQNEMLWEAKGL